MIGPDIFSNPLISAIYLLMIAVVMILFLTKFMSQFFAKNNIFKTLELLKLFVVFIPLAVAFSSLFNYVSFDLVSWINFEVVALSCLYFAELIIKQMKVMHK